MQQELLSFSLLLLFVLFLFFVFLPVQSDCVEQTQRLMLPLQHLCSVIKTNPSLPCLPLPSRTRCARARPVPVSSCVIAQSMERWYCVKVKVSTKVTLAIIYSQSVA